MTSTSLTLESFGADLRAVVVGANGGIGAALVSALAASPRVARVYATARPAAWTGEPGSQHKVTRCQMDVTDEQSTVELAARCRQDGPLDIVLVATGVLHDSADLQPEKSWKSLDGEALAHSFKVNAIGPALVAKHFMALLTSQRKSVFAVLSARVGSIEDNRLGGWHAYRASKAALNMLMRTCSIELARRNANAICVSLHPGTVDTALSRPFQTNVPAGKLFPPALAASQLLAVIDHLDANASGGFYAWDGERIPF